MAGYGDETLGDLDRRRGGDLWAGGARRRRHGPTIPTAELRAIRVLLRSFVPEAVGRDHPGKAWDLATSDHALDDDPRRVAAGIAAGVPVPCPQNDVTASGPITVGPNAVTFDLMLQPRAGSDVGVEVYTTEVRRIDGRWLVDSMAASAQFAGPGGPATITAQPDFAPHVQGIAHHDNLSGKWVLVPIAVISLPLIVAPLGMLLLWRRGRATATGRGDDRAVDRSLEVTHGARARGECGARFGPAPDRSRPRRLVPDRPDGASRQVWPGISPG